MQRVEWTSTWSSRTQWVVSLRLCVCACVRAECACRMCINSKPYQPHFTFYVNYCMHLPSLPSPPLPFLRSPPLPSPSLPALAVHDPQWYAVFTSQLTPEHTQLVQEMLAVAAYRKQYKGQGSVEWSKPVWECGVLCEGVECYVRVWSALPHPTHPTHHSTPHIPHLTALHTSHTSQHSTHLTPHSTPHIPHLTQHSRPLHCTLSSPSSESKEIEKAGGYQFTVTHMPNSFAFGGGNVPASFQWPHGMKAVLQSLLHGLCGTPWNCNFINFMPYMLWRCFDFVHMTLLLL